MKILTIDAGNTSITWGLWKNSSLLKRGSHLTTKFKTIKLPRAEKIIYASVVPHIDNFFRKKFSKQNFREITWKDIPLKIALKKKAEIGIDRLVNAAGAVNFYGAPLIIIDLGTATTFCIVDKKKTYQGGLICPGINLTRYALYEKTAKLPLIELKRPKRIIGKNTIEAMQAGIFFGYQALLSGLIQKIKKEIPNAKVIATGGYANLLARDLSEKIDIVEPNLTLRSLLFLANSCLK